jgi:uncharacterized protein YqgC (DUF456 family)
MLEWWHSVWNATAHFVQSVPWACIGVWTLTLSLLVLGVIGSVLPLLPGPLLIFVAGVIHTLLRPESAMSWQGLVVLGLLTVIAYLFDFVSGAMGAKWFGASRWGIAGVFIGGIVGLFFSLPGLILGPIVGGLAFELLFAKKEMRPAMKSTWGTIVGTGAGLVLRLAISLAMVAVFFVDALWW